MSTKQANRWAAGLLLVALAACSSDMNRNTSSTDTGMSSGSSSSSNTCSTGSSGTAGTGSSTPSSADTSGYSNPASTSGSTSSNMSSTDTGTSQSQQTSYGTVAAIEPMKRQDVGVGAVGAAAAGGSVGSPNDNVWRVNVKMDDGTSQMVVLDSQPSYKVGDRVRYSNGTLTSY